MQIHNLAKADKCKRIRIFQSCHHQKQRRTPQNSL